MDVVVKQQDESLVEPSVKLSDKALKDYKIVNMAKSGDERAFKELFSRYRESVFFMILKMVNNRTDAEDLTFEAFEKAFSNLSCYSPQYAFSTWLFKIASNNTIDFIRRRKNLTISIDKDDNDPNERSFVHTLAADELNPEQQAIRIQRALFTREKVSMLKGRYRRLIELRYFDEMSYEEISEELNIPLGTVKAQLFRARELLMELLQFSELRDGE